MRVDFACIAAAAMTLLGCATAPSMPNLVPGAFLPKPLALCAGGGSNLPAADSEHRVENFSPTAEIRGATLARAPVAGCLSSGFGARTGGAGSFHKGIDLVTMRPEPIFAAADGVVVEALERKNYGLTVLLMHRNGVQTRYAHLSAFAPGLKAGGSVEFGQEIGRTGKTGNATVVHLHYEVLVDGTPVNPLTLGTLAASY